MSRSTNPRNLIISVIFIFILLTISALSIPQIKNDEGNTEVLSIETSQASELEYWYEILSENPTYQEAWIRIYEIETENGNIENAEFALKNSRLNNPNDPKVIEYEKQVLYAN